MLATRPVDFRKGADGLSALVQETMGADPFSGAVYVFRAKPHDAVLDLGPAELAVLQTLCEQADAGAIPEHELDPIGPLSPRPSSRPFLRVSIGGACTSRGRGPRRLRRAE